MRTYDSDDSDDDSWRRGYASYVLVPLFVLLALLPWPVFGLPAGRSALLCSSAGIFVAGVVETAVSVGDSAFGVISAVVGIVCHALPLVLALALWRPRAPFVVAQPRLGLRGPLGGGAAAAVGLGALAMALYWSGAVAYPYDAGVYTMISAYLSGVAIGAVLGMHSASTSAAVAEYDRAWIAKKN